MAKAMKLNLLRSVGSGAVKRFRLLGVFACVLLLLLYCFAYHRGGILASSKEYCLAAKESPYSSAGITFVERDSAAALQQTHYVVRRACMGEIMNPYKETESWKTFEKELERYKVFHKQQMALLRNMSLDPETWRGHPDARRVRTLTWACSEGHCSGLGDEMLRIQIWLLLAMAADRVFVLHWDEKISRTTKYLLPNEIDWSFHDESLGMCSDQIGHFGDCQSRTFSKVGWTWDKWEKDQYAKFSKSLFSAEPHITVTGRVDTSTMLIADKSFFEEGTLIRKGFDRLGLSKLFEMDKNNKVEYTSSRVWYTNPRVWYTETWYAMSHRLFHYLFQFPQSLIDEVDKAQKKHGLWDRKYLAFHLRTGFKGGFHQEGLAIWNMRNWKCFPDKDSWNVMFKHSVDLASKKLGGSAQVYLATDSPEAKDWAVHNYGERIVTSNATVEHSTHGDTWCESNDKSHGAPFSFWIDFLLLARAQFLVLGYSSYAVAAGFICPIPLSNQSWISFDETVNCLASHIRENVSCI